MSSQTVFTTLLIDHGDIQNLDQHILRLHQTANVLHLPYPHWQDHFLKRYLNNYPIQKGQWRLKIFLNEDNYSFELEPYAQNVTNGYRLCLYPEPIKKKPLKIHPYDRESIFQQAVKLGYDDALTLSPESYVLETAYANIFWRYHQELFTPSSELPLLFGITIQNIKEKIKQVKVKLEDIPAESNLYLCNSLRGIQPINSIASKQFPRDFAFEKKLSRR